MTAALILYNRLGYTGLNTIEDARIQLRGDEMFWMPGTIEVFKGIAIPKH